MVKESFEEQETQKADFIDEGKIEYILTAAKFASREQVEEILTKAEDGKGLKAEEAAILMEVEDQETLARMYRLASILKERIYGKRVVLFAPLYISNYCVNNCRYCGYRRDNKMERRRLTMDELNQEVTVLESMGHKRLALECGEDPANSPIEYVVEALKTIYGIKEGNGSIRRVNVNIAATTVTDYRLLKEAGIGTYILFQETYHRASYNAMHPSGPKRDYDWHTTAMDRAMQAGIDDVGLGVLFGLYDHKYELVALLEHARHLEEAYGVGPHTISVPRLRAAKGVELEGFADLMADQDFEKLVAVIRLALPYTGIILSTRERPEIRNRLLHQGVSQISAGSCTGVGEYRREQISESYLLTEQSAMPKTSGNKVELKNTADTADAENSSNIPQFVIEDHRTPDETAHSICQSGFIPSFCTACYRQGRTGDRFMALAKSGQIQYVCQPNAILTFKEYLLDYASELTRLSGQETIKQHLAQIPSEERRQQTEERLRRIENGERDLYF